ncbi:MAG: nucleoside 2-deoxyribosyltransferase [Thermodesulfobacteriota bacterium]
MNQEPKIVYCSGPLFSPEERAAMESIALTLRRAGFGVFVPHQDGLEALVMRFANDPLARHKAAKSVNRFVHRAIFALDIYQIVERCRFLVFNMNGRVPDEGAVAETAVAFAAGKPLVIYKEDHRTEFNGSDNSMITGLSYTFATVSRIPDIPAELLRVEEKLAALGPSPYQGGNIPPHMRGVLDFGRKVWRVLSSVRPGGASPEEGMEKLAEVSDLAGRFSQLAPTTA